VILKRCDECGISPIVDECRAKVEHTTDDGRFVVSFETNETDAGKYQDVLLGLRGQHQIVNVAVAIQLAESLRRRGFEITHHAIVAGITTATHAGRLDLYDGEPCLLLDGAHNPSGARALRDYLNQFVKVPLTLVFGAMNDKRLEEIATILFPAAAHLILTQPDNPRAASPEALQSLAATVMPENKIMVSRTPGEALQKARQLTPSGGMICVTGSLYLVGEIKAILNTTEYSEAVRA